MLSSQLHDLHDALRLPPNAPQIQKPSETAGTPEKKTSKARSLSDGSGPPALSPSPKFREPEKRKSKDDSAINDSPITPRRPAFLQRGLSLQMPPRDMLMSPNTSAYINRVPLSPKLDHSQTYGSPTSVLPRRSRGLDYSRAATNLHHSTLAEASSPDSSPTIGGRAMNIPSRNSGIHGMGGLDNTSLWSAMPVSERMNVSSSLGSVNMMGSDDSSSNSDDDLMDADDIDESILTTPQVNKMATPFGVPHASPGTGWMAQSAAVSSLMNFQNRQRVRNKRSTGMKIANNSGMKSKSPGSRSPPMQRGFGSMDNMYMVGEAHSRRESISWAANQLHISENESDDGLKSTLENAEGLPVTPGRDGRPGVIRRAVTRRGNMLPKTKGFARIRAALAEESAPVETEVLREAQVVKQARESDMDLEPRHHSITSQTSPTTIPSQDLGDIPEDDIMDIASGLSNSFKQHAMKNSKGKDFWDNFSDDNGRTPPPGPLLPRHSSSNISDDLLLDSSALSTPSSGVTQTNIFGPASDSQARPSTPHTGPTQAEIRTKVNNKRRRDDDFDIASFKRRAVSPGMSVHNSPIMPSPMQRDHTPWGSRPPSNGDGKHSTGNPKRVGLQGMTDTSENLMKMSIE